MDNDFILYVFKNVPEHVKLSKFILFILIPHSVS